MSESLSFDVAIMAALMVQLNVFYWLLSVGVRLPFFLTVSLLFCFYIAVGYVFPFEDFSVFGRFGGLSFVHFLCIIVVDGDDERDIKRITCWLHHLYQCISCPLSVRSAEGLRLQLTNHLVLMTVQSPFLSIHYVPPSAVNISFHGCSVSCDHRLRRMLPTRWAGQQRLRGT
jgi:hypothetical protein